jgi:uncharacterized protein (DUF3084 family)
MRRMQAGLLYAAGQQAAGTVDDTAALQAELVGAQQAREAAESRAVQAEARAAAAETERGASRAGAGAVSTSAGAGAAEHLEMRTKLVLAQQEVQRRVADSRDLVSRLQAAVAEKDRLLREKTDAEEEHATNKSGFERQSAVIQQLMAQSEELARDRCDASSPAVGLRTLGQASREVPPLIC